MFEILAQADNDGAAATAVAGIFGSALCCFFAFLAIPGIITIISWWKIFEKAGKPGWASLIPIYNVIIILEIVGRPMWWIFLMFFPPAAFVLAIILCIDLAKSFGKDAIYGIGMVFLGIIFFPMLAFGDAKYVGPSVQA